MLQKIKAKAFNWRSTGPVVEFSAWIRFSIRTLINFPRAFQYGNETYKQIYLLGNQALSLIVIAAVFASMALALEWSKQLNRFDAKLFSIKIFSSLQKNHCFAQAIRPRCQVQRFCSFLFLLLFLDLLRNIRLNRHLACFPCLNKRS
jgi:hypothetical protein